MITEKYFNELLTTNDAYDNYEDKNYYLVHKLMELILILDEAAIENLKDKIFQNFEYKNYSCFLQYVCVASKNNTHPPSNTTEPIEVIEEDVNILDFYTSYDKNLISYIKGHLFIEFSMNKIIEKSCTGNHTKKTFSEKIALLYKNSIISESENTLLKSINKQRNEIAHNLRYNLTFDIIYDLVLQAGQAGIDFSDETIYKNKKLSLEWYGISGVINELFPNIFCHLLFENQELFDDVDDVMKYMS